MERYMRLALKEAQKAELNNEVPAGALLFDKKQKKILALGHNQVISSSDPTAHAEIIVLKKAAQLMGNYRLNNTILFSTLEPCPMCLTAAVHARVEVIYFGAREPKWGACGSLFNLLHLSDLNHRPEVVGGLLALEAQKLIVDFFKKRRLKNNKVT